MEFFYKYFGSPATDKKEWAVCCPFPHKAPDGSLYKELNPSAHINTEKALFHCKVCKVGLSEANFMAKIQGISYGQALQFLDQLNSAEEENWKVMVDNLKASKPTMETLYSLGFDERDVDSLQLGYRGDGIAFPVFMYGELLDIRTYSPNRKPKVIGEKGSKPLLFPFDLWREDFRPTLLCAGEKDTAMARKMGFNALTVTGGEGAFPNLFKGYFKDRTVYICYDNDGAGFDGSRRVGAILRDTGAVVHIVDLSPVCAGKGEDIHDFFQKYKKSSDDLQQILDSTPVWAEDEYQVEKNKAYPLVTLEEARKGENSGRVISSRVSVVASYDDVFHVPEVVEFECIVEPPKGESKLFPHWLFKQRGDKAYWYLTEDNLKDMLKLADSNLKETDVQKHLKQMMRIPDKFFGVRIHILSKLDVWKVTVTDDFESEVISEDDWQTYQPSELTIYSIGSRLLAGEKYRVFYKTFAHPLQGQKVVGVSNRVETSDNSINAFRVSEDVIRTLQVFKGTAANKMTEEFERSKAFVGNFAQKEVVWTVALFYHTPLWFTFRGEVERAYLEPILVGESRTGKSKTAEKYLRMLELGVFTSLKTATIGGLIGGSQQTGSGYKTRLGLIPRNHKGAIIFEEFSGGGRDFIKRLTDIRSSNQVRIERVSGTTKAPAMVRMLSISNQATGSNGQTIPLRQYPNGIKVLLDLIGAAEDVGRYDFAVLVDKPKEYADIMDAVGAEPYPKESMMNRVRWIWSRRPDQIIISDDVMRFVSECTKKLNQQYDSHINFFGPEAWKKIVRLAIAVAAIRCSMDESGEKLIVEMQDVSWAKDFLVSCYDNPLFRIKSYVENERKYKECNPAAVQALQGIWNQHSTLIKQMELASEMSRQQLKDLSGLDNDQFAEVMNRMAECYFFNWVDGKIVPSERFREALSQINRNNYVKRVGEQ